MTKDIFSWSLKNCSSCAHWGSISSVIESDDGVLNLCNLKQRGHNRSQDPDWMRGSDFCSKWGKKDSLKS